MNALECMCVYEVYEDKIDFQGSGLMKTFFIVFLFLTQRILVSVIKPMEKRSYICNTVCYSYKSIKDRNGMDLTEAEDIKKRWQEYTEGLYKKYLNDPDNNDGVITHLESDILECEVKRALESITRIKLVEVMEFQWSYFKS